MKIARHPQTEVEGQIEWFERLREAVERDDKDIALRTIDGAIEMYRRIASGGVRPSEADALSKHR
jgi:hypothetical protein